MCIGSKPSVPAAPEVQAAPQEQDAAVVSARDDEERRRRAAAGTKSTMLKRRSILLQLFHPTTNYPTAHRKAGGLQSGSVQPAIAQLVYSPVRTFGQDRVSGCSYIPV